MAKRERISLPWMERPKSGTPQGGVGRLKVWRESTHCYRIDHYVDHGEYPFFALANRQGSRPRKRMWELISRHSTLVEAIRACEEDAARSNGFPS